MTATSGWSPTSGDLEVKDGYRTQTLGTLIVGIAGILNVLLVSLLA